MNQLDESFSQKRTQVKLANQQPLNKFFKFEILQESESLKGLSLEMEPAKWNEYEVNIIEETN